MELNKVLINYTCDRCLNINHHVHEHPQTHKYSHSWTSTQVFTLLNTLWSEMSTYKYTSMNSYCAASMVSRVLLDQGSSGTRVSESDVANMLGW